MLKQGCSAEITAWCAEEERQVVECEAGWLLIDGNDILRARSTASELLCAD